MSTLETHGREAALHPSRDKILRLTFASTAGVHAMDTQHRVIRATTAGGAIATTLPSVALARGMTFSFLLTVGGANWTIASADGAIIQQGVGGAAGTTITLGTALEGVLLYSDGFDWWITALATAGVAVA